MEPNGHPPSLRPSRIMLVDCQTMTRLGLSHMITMESRMKICAEATGVSEALLAMETARPDLVILDIVLKDGSGLNLIEQIHRQWPQTRMLVFSMQAESLFADRAIRAGARGYVRKDETLQTIMETIHHVLDGRIYLSQDMTERMLKHHPANGNSSENSLIDSLSNRELEVFQLIARGQTRSELAHCLHLSVKTIETHQENIKRKFNLRSNQELVCRAVEWMLGQQNQYGHNH